MTTGHASEGTGGSPPRSLVARLLSPIAEVRPGEAGDVLLMALVMFLTLAAYYMLKTAREVFILSQGGAEVKSYSSAGQSLLLLLLVPAYGAFASRVNRTRLVRWVTLFFVSNIVLFYLAAGAGLRIGIVYFVWVGIFNVMVIAQLWAFSNDIFSPEQGKRLFPIIGLGANLGAWAGSVRAGELVSVMGPLRLLLSGGGALVICVLLVELVSRRAKRSQPQTVAAAAEKPLGREGGFQLIFKDRYLTLLALLAVLLNVVNTSGEYLFGRYVVETANALHGSGPEAAALRERYIGSTYSELYSAVNLTGFLTQMFIVSRVFKYLGVGKALFIHPLVAGIGYLFLLRRPSITAMHWIKVADNSVDYSLGNTTKQALWLPTSREAKYKAKQAVDSFFVRAGDVLQAGTVYAGERLALTVPGFAGINIALVGAWLSVAAMINASLSRKAREENTAAL